MKTYLITPMYRTDHGYVSRLGMQYNHIPVQAENINELRKRLLRKYDGDVLIKVLSPDMKKKRRLEYGELRTLNSEWVTIDYIKDYGQVHTHYKVRPDGTLGAIIKKK